MTTASGSPELKAALRRVLRPGMTIALGDGIGAVRSLDDGTVVCAAISAVALEIGAISLIVGWLPVPLTGLEPDAFIDIVALMPAGGCRDILRSPVARFVPTSLSAIAALLAGPARPDLLLTRLVERNGRLHWGTEVSWQREIVDAGVPVCAIVDAGPSASAEPALNTDEVVVIGRGGGPARLPANDPEPVHDALADAVLRFVPPGARVQYGPGQLGTALLRRASVPLRLDTGLLTDAVVDLDARGLLIGEPSATYLVGSDILYDWADGRPILRGIDHTHNLGRLSHGDPFIAVNAAIEIDPFGQVNVEGIADKVVGGIGGHPDYCAAGHASRCGLSIIAVPSRYGGRSPLVDRLTRTASTTAHNVDLIVTESGYADLRTADWPRRRQLITALFETQE